MNFPAYSMPEFLQIPVNQQKKLVLSIISVIIISSNPTNSQFLSSSPTDDSSKSSDSTTKFHPSIAVVIGVLSIMLSLTFLLMVYAKCWHRPSSFQYLNQENFSVLPRSSVPKISGIDKTVIKSLPSFQFSTLKGWRNGLECSICLSRFEDVEILRLLPKCKHAFHINCVDHWLEKHSGCPLCRRKVTEEDVTHFAYSSSFRFLNNQSAHEGSNMELFVEREGSSRFGSQRSVQVIQEVDNKEILEDEEILHKFNHRIIISDFEHSLMDKNRWSNMSSSDLLFLKSEMITSLSSNFFQDDHNPDPDHHVIKLKDEIEKIPGGGMGSLNHLKSAKLVEKRSISEIIIHPRFLGHVESSYNKEASFSEISSKDERLKRLWLPIARRTIQMFANKDQPTQINKRSHV